MGCSTKCQYYKMGCCASKDDFRNSKQGDETSQNPYFSWNTNQLQAKDFEIDGANLKLADERKMPHRICSKNPFPKNGQYTIKVRYVQRKGNGSFSLGICHYGDKSQQSKTEKMGMKNIIRLFVSRKEAEIQARGEVLFHSKNWGAHEEDTITMTLNMDSKFIEWSKQNNMENMITQREILPPGFAHRNLYLQLIVYEPQTELNIQAGRAIV